jgi:undecaprenyl-diphosphatase
MTSSRKVTFRSFFNFRRIIAWLREFEPVVLASVATLVISVWLFGVLASMMLKGNTQAIDEMVMLVFRHPDNAAVLLGPRWFQEMARDFTSLGSVGWLVFSVFCVAGYLVLDKKSQMAAFVVASTTGGFILSSLLKYSFQRPRPDIVPHISHVYTSSFPSSHSMLSAVSYLTLGALVSSVVKRPLLKMYLLAIATLISMLVGATRVYLGVHYPTDVLAGWIAGLSWVLICTLSAKRLRYLE